MEGGFLSFYQHIPEHIDPVIFSAGFFSLRWYSIGYLAGFLVVYLLLVYRIKRGEYDILEIPNPKSQIPNKFQNIKSKNKNFVFDLLLYCFVGLLLGARLGYVFFYDLGYFLQNPLEIFLPLRVTGYGLRVTGIYGMSYFGGFIGVILAGYIFAKKNNLNFLKLVDFVVPAIPAGYFFGRIGNFLNGELYGRTTDAPWGMYFPADSYLLLRHPSQLYEAFFEGIVLFLILWNLRNSRIVIAREFRLGTTAAISSLVRKLRDCFVRRGGLAMTKGELLLLYIFLYAFFRFFIEFFREPDTGAELFFSFLTKGQILSIILAAISFVIFITQKRKNSV